VLQASREVKDALRQLTDTPNCHVMVVSSQKKDIMLDSYEAGAPKLGLAAENGFYYSLEADGKW
jgi:trehalose-6-phosphatase